ncbi:MAG TPA: sulfite exporter TauE/SafE family protein, partial [Saprospiraceae bacterium]|nr:sulfite exporter TauE/SafE family protein [Saprospiraceae bacterium]
GTNRIGVLMQTFASGWELNKKHNQELKNSRGIIITTILGAILGVYFASVISNEQFKIAYKFMMVFMLFIILVKPSRWLIKSNLDRNLPQYIILPAYFFVGVYGGFIQMGVGIFLLAALVLLSGYTIMNSNLIKALIVGSYTVIVLIIFQIKGLVNWEAGIVIAISQGIGGWLTAKYANRSVYIEKIAYVLLVIITLVSVLYQFL